MKKIAFYVEGQTELIFINKLLVEIAGSKNIDIKPQNVHNNPVILKTVAQPQNPQYYALIFDCSSDSNVKPRILQDAVSLFNQGYSEIVGLIDFYSPHNRTTFTFNDLSMFENELSNGTLRNGRRITQPLPNDTSIVIAVREIEDWFLAECNHYTCIDASLVLDEAQTASLGFNPCIDDLTIRGGSAASDLHRVYKLAGKAYLDNQGNKPKKRAERTVECLDYANLYVEVRCRVPKLNELIDKIDNFLT